MSDAGHNNLRTATIAPQGWAMNRPIGIPSGWEEVAAFYMANEPRAGVICLKLHEMKYIGNDGPFWHMTHDWRVEE